MNPTILNPSAIIISLSPEQLQHIISQAVEVGVASALIKDRKEKEGDKLLTHQQASQLLQVSQKTLHNWVLEGRIKQRQVGRSIRYLRSDIDFAIEGGVTKKYLHIAK